MSPQETRQLLESLAAKAGFDCCGVAPAVKIDREQYYRRWLGSGRAGGLEYLRRHVEKRLDAAALAPGARSVIVCALNYRQDPSAEAVAGADRPRGRVAMYAWGGDYHDVVRTKLEEVLGGLRAARPGPWVAKVCVDTAPLLEREYAVLAGIGWIGKNTLVLNRRLGSYFFLGEIVTELELPVDEPAADRCGACTRCLEACPTGALAAPYEMDASRCISYLTIECRDEQLPGETHQAIGDWVFGCDVCQQVCPHNRQTPPTGEPHFAIRPPGPRPDLHELLTLSDEACRALLRDSAMRRARPEMLRRNARIAIGNVGRGPD